MDAAQDGPSSVIAVDKALRTLGQSDPRVAELIEMRLFGRLTAEEPAEVLNLPVVKIRAQRRIAQA